MDGGLTYCLLEEGSTRMRAPVGKRCSADLFVHLDPSTFALFNIFFTFTGSCVGVIVLYIPSLCADL
jgi:hypothetical protein